MISLRATLVPIALCALACGGGDGSGTPAPADQDVRGVYAVTWDNTFVVRLDIGGAVQSYTVSDGDVVTFNAPDGSPLEFDISAYCADPAVTCPSEAWPGNVAIDQDSPEVYSDGHTLRAWDADAPAAVVSGLVDHRNDQFLFGLDSASGGSGNCAALAISLAGGTFSYGSDTADTAASEGPVGVEAGSVAVGWLGVCAWEGLAVAATLSVETGYTAERISDL